MCAIFIGVEVSRYVRVIVDKFETKNKTEEI